MQTSTIITLAEAYADHRGLKLSTVSTYAVNDGKWLAGLKGGASCTIRKATNCVAWLSSHWPEDLQWPPAIPRPTPNKKDAA